MCGRYFVQCGFIKVCIFFQFFWKARFLVFLWAFCIFCLFCVEFDVSFIVNFLALHKRCLQSSRCQLFYVFVLFYLKQFFKTDTHHKNVSIALNKSMPLESFWALKNFWLLKVPFIKENVEHSQTEGIKMLSTNIISRNLLWTFGHCKQHCSVIVEITDIKCGLLSKHLFQRTQHHGGFTKPLGNDKFV